MDVPQLIHELQNGNRQAFRQMVETYQQRVYNTVLAIIQKPEEAEDVSQEVFIQVFQSIHQLAGDMKLTAWIYRIATTKALEAYRKNRAQKRFAFFTNLFAWDEVKEVFDDQFHPIEFEHPGVKLEQQERAKVLFSAINRLPEKQKTAFTLHHIEGLTYQEISEIMQTTLSSVESLLFRAKMNLRKQLGTYYQQDFDL